MVDPAGTRKVLIYRNDLLERSETFIAAQAGALRRYQPVFCGMRRKSGCELAGLGDPITLTDGEDAVSRCRRAAYLYAGVGSGWMRQVEAAQPALVHAHFALDAACALPLVKRLQVPLLVTLHGYDVTRTLRSFRDSRVGRLYLRRREQLFREARTFLCVSNFIREQAIAAGYPAEKLWVHSIGIDLQAFSTSRSLTDEGRCEVGPRILFVGRLVEKKGCEYLLRAMQRVQRKHPEARLMIAGDGPLRSTLEQLAHDLKLCRVSFLGAQSPQKIRGLLGAATIFSVPSITAADGDAEGLGMVFLEAQAMGVPVVGFRSGGVCEAVAHGETGLLADEKDDASLAQHICRLLGDRALLGTMQQNGIRRVKEKFDLFKQTRLLENRYDEVLGR